MALHSITIISIVAIICATQLSLSDAGNVRELKSLDEFRNSVHSGKMVFMEFYATWCPYCNYFNSKVMDKIGDKVKSGKLKDKINVDRVQCDSDAGRPICRNFAVEMFPLLNLYRDGKFFESYWGKHSADAVVSYMEMLLESGKPQHFAKLRAKANEPFCLATDYFKYVNKHKRS